MYYHVRHYILEEALRAFMCRFIYDLFHFSWYWCWPNVFIL